MAITIIQSEQPFDEADFKKRLIDEYKILQDKMDKIGGFRFTIKGWSVTAVIAASAAGGATKGLLAVITISVGLAFMLLFFFRFELEQVKLSRLFGNRVRKLEEGFRILDRNKGRTTTAPIPVPFTAHEIVQASYAERLRAQQVGGHGHRSPRFLDRWSARWRVFKQAHISFYALLIFLAFFLPLLPRYNAIWTHFKQLRSNAHHSEPARHLLPCSPSGIPEC